MTDLTREEFQAVAAPPCPECGKPVQRTEIRWSPDADGRWMPGCAFMVCPEGHRVRVEPM